MSSVMTILSLPKYRILLFCPVFLSFSSPSILLTVIVVVSNLTHPQPIIDYTSFLPFLHQSTVVGLLSSARSPFHQKHRVQHNPVEVIQIFNLGLSLIGTGTLKREINLEPVLFEFVIPDTNSGFSPGPDLFNYQPSSSL